MYQLISNEELAKLTKGNFTYSLLREHKQYFLDIKSQLNVVEKYRKKDGSALKIMVQKFRSNYPVRAKIIDSALGINF